MAKRNRRHKTCHVKPVHGLWVVLFLFAVVPWGLYSLLTLQADQVANEIKRLEQKHREQNASLVRVSAVWNQMMEPQRLNEAIARQGLAMSAATPDRQVRVNTQTNRFYMNAKLKRDLADVRRRQAGGVLATTQTRTR